MKLLCIDGNSVLNRAFYGIKLLTTKDGRYTNAIYGFMNIFLKLITDYEPDRVAVAFDMRAKTFRHKLYDKYKANRKGMPEELAEQLPVLKKLLAALGYAIVECEGYEADDILGTFSRAAGENGFDCLIATGDRDSLQLVGGATTVLLTATHFGRGELSVMDEAAVEEKYGVKPMQLIEIKALMGDASDNIPGVAGVGEKTAAALIQRFKSVDGVYENIDSPDIKQGVRDKLLAGRDMAYLSRTLGTIDRSAPINTDIRLYVKKEGDPRAASSILSELEMPSLVSRLGLGAVKAPDAVAEAPQKEVAAQPLAGEMPAGNAYLMSRAGKWYACAGDSVFVLDEDQVRAAAADKNIKKYCYNSKELAVFCEGNVCNVVFDVRLAAYLLNPLASDYSLPLLGAAYHASPVFTCAEAPEIALLHPLCDRLQNQLEADGMDKLLSDVELPLAVVLAKMESRGFLLDTDGIRRFGDYLSGKIENLSRAICTEAGRDFNLNSPRQLAQVLVDCGVPLKKKTKSGFSTDADTLNSLRGTHPMVDEILSYRTYQKLNSTYVEGLLKAADTSHRVHTEFNQTETRTGRISSLNPNLQNIPVRTELGSNFRKYFIAGSGNRLLDADYSQIELRVLAHMSGDARMIEDFISGSDIHTETASRVFGVDRSEVTPLMRRRAKAVNFGIVYGIGAFSLSQDIGVSVKEASKYIENYLQNYAGVRDYLERTVEDAKRDGFVTTMYGRRRRLPELANSNRNIQALGKRLAMNTPIQGTAADIIKIAMVEAEEAFEKSGLDARLILQVHDELIVECSEKDADAAAKILKSTMEGAAKLSVPLTVDVGVGGSWYDAKL